MRKKILLTLFILAFLLAASAAYSLLPGYLSQSSSNQAFAASYNPAPDNKFKAPISSVGLIGLNHPTPARSIDLSKLPTTKPGFAPDNSANNVVSNSVNSNALRFINDGSYFPQTETTVAVDPSNTQHVVGGVNDLRYFFCGALPADCPTGYTISLSGFSVSSDGGASLLKSNDIQGLPMAEKNLTSHKTVQGFLVSWGDPEVVAATDGNFYYASLAIDPVSGANGIMIAKSNSQLFSANSCSTPLANPVANPCWNARFVFGNLTFSCPASPINIVGGTCGPSTFEDKDTIAVDTNKHSAFYGSVYIAWDHFFDTGLSSSYIARCTPDLGKCVMVSGGGSSIASATDPFTAFTTVVVGKGGNVYVTWCNYGTFTTLGPISCRTASAPPGGKDYSKPVTVVSFEGAGTTFPNYTGLVGFATEQFRTASVPVIAADVSSGNLYFTVDACTQGSYYAVAAPALPGDCGKSAILFSSSTDGGKTWSAPVTVSNPAVNVQPFVTVDQSSGEVHLVYLTTQFDRFNHRIDVVDSYSTNAGATWATARLTTVSNEPNSDPTFYNYLAPFGGSWDVPQYGDYIQAAAANGHLWTLFTADYQSELGTLQADPFLVVK
jgi:hypothetical protein